MATLHLDYDALCVDGIRCRFTSARTQIIQYEVVHARKSTGINDGICSFVPSQ